MRGSREIFSISISDKTKPASCSNRTYKYLGKKLKEEKEREKKNIAREKAKKDLEFYFKRRLKDKRKIEKKGEKKKKYVCTTVESVGEKEKKKEGL